MFSGVLPVHGQYTFRDQVGLKLKLLPAFVQLTQILVDGRGVFVTLLDQTVTLCADLGDLRLVTLYLSLG